MKKLHLVRHADAEHAGAAISDHSRKLTLIGRQRADSLAQNLIRQQVTPDIIITSDAVRAIQTAEILAKAFAFKSELIRENKIYSATDAQLLDYFMMIEPQYASLLLVGHNPTLSQFAAAHLHEMSRSMPPASAVGLVYDIDGWHEIAANHCQLLYYE